MLRGGYGHATIFAPLFQIESIYTPPAQYKNIPATYPICGGSAGNFSQPCANYYDELQNAWWKGFGLDPYSFPKAQQSDSYDLSLEQYLPFNISARLTGYYRRDYDVIVNRQNISVQNGTVIPGTISVTNDGQARSTGFEFALSREVPQGLSTLLSVSYLNQFVNYTNFQYGPAFRPGVSPALLDSGTLVHAPYISPLTATASLDYHRRGWRVNPIFRYSRGFPTGVWNNVPVISNGTVAFVPNTNLFGNFGGQYCSYVDPQNPGTATQPNIVGSLGGGCTQAQNGALTKPSLYTDLTVSRELGRRATLGIVWQNVFANLANAPYLNPGYVNNGFGSYGPQSGLNPAALLPGAVTSYSPAPWLTFPSGASGSFTAYLQVRI